MGWPPNLAGRVERPSALTVSMWFYVISLGHTLFYHTLLCYFSNQVLIYHSKLWKICSNLNPNSFWLIPKGLIDNETLKKMMNDKVLIICKLWSEAMRFITYNHTLGLLVGIFGQGSQALSQWILQGFHQISRGQGHHPNSKVPGANMRPIWGRQDPGGPHVGPRNFAIWDTLLRTLDAPKVSSEENYLNM